MLYHDTGNYMVSLTGLPTRYVCEVLIMTQVTQLEQTMNVLVALMFALQLTLAALGAIGNHVFLTRMHATHRRKDEGPWYLQSTG